MQKTTMSQHIPKMMQLVEHIVFHFIGKSKELTTNQAFFVDQIISHKVFDWSDLQRCTAYQELNLLISWETEEFLVNSKVKSK